MIFATFAISLPAIAMPTRGWLKLSGYLVTFNALFSIVIGLYLWITTLRTKETFSPVWNGQLPQVQDLMQTTVSFHHSGPRPVRYTTIVLTTPQSSTAAATSTAHRPPSSPTPRARPLPPRPSCAAAPRPSRASPMSL